MSSPYAELHCLTHFSFLRGASHPEELVERAHALGYAALAITDECSMSGVVRAHLEAKRLGLKLIVGTEVALVEGPKLILLATDREGYGRVCALITAGRRSAAKGAYHLGCLDLADGLTGCLVLVVPKDPRTVASASGADPLERHARSVAERFPGRAWLAVELHRGPDDRQRLLRLRALGKEAGLPLVAAGDVHMHACDRRALQDTLTAIRLKTTIDSAGDALFPNGERHMRSRETLARLYPPELLAETVAIADRCRFSLDELRYEYPDELVPEGETAASRLRRLTEIGVEHRFPGGVPDKVRQLVEHELRLIAELRYEPYFLTVHDIVAFARSRGILCQGRGSAANSAVCYLLGITEVDPSRMNMLFERFVSKQRNEPPDIDVDFEHERREEVIQYLYRKYGRDRAALCAAVITYRAKSAIRDVGKALGLDLDCVDRLSRSLAWWDRGRAIPERLQEVGLDPASPRVKLLHHLATTLIGFPRHLSQHVGGFVISRGPLSRLVPIENAAMPDRTVIQWDKNDLDALGLLKVDVLGLGMLSAIRRALAMVSRRRGRPFGMAEVPPEDPAVYQMLGRADSIGVFQVESRAQMSMLPRLRPQSFYDLVVEVAIIRPGPIQGGMVHPYLRRRQGLEPVTYPSEAVRTVLERTLGIPIFQEQVMQLAVVAAGFTPGEADQLRRYMATWRTRGGIQKFEQRLIDGMRARGYSEEFARAIYQQILGFGEYGFPESHAASFALLVYISAWLKRYEPAAFLCALLNSQPMGFYAPAQLIQDARRHGVEVRPADVTVSDWDCTLELDREPAARLGLRMVKGLRQEAARRMVAARATGPFSSVEDLGRRARLARHDLRCLAATGALASLAGHRRQAHWQAAGPVPAPGLLHAASFDEPVLELPAPGEAQDLIDDYASLGFTLGRHPLAFLRPRLRALGLIPAAELNRCPDRRAASTAGLVTCRQRPGTATGVMFLTLEDETGVVNIVVHSRLVEGQRKEVLGARLLGVFGRVQREGEVIHLVADRLVDHTPLLGQLQTGSRDFH